jgi:hypothetical protein
MIISHADVEVWLWRKLPACLYPGTLRDITSERKVGEYVDRAINHRAGITRWESGNTEHLIKLARRNGRRERDWNVGAYLTYLAYEARGGGTDMHAKWARRWLRKYMKRK